MSRAVIYARFSSDLQREASIEDQIRLCRERIERDGNSLSSVYQDKAVSGASLLRPGIQRLLQDAGLRRFDVVYAEALDRISRDQEDVAGVFKRLKFADMSIVTLAEGEISELHVGLKGTMNALFLKDLADKTRRGLRGRVEAGRSGGGNSYGYDVIQMARPDGTVDGGRRCVNQTEASIVRRIFREYAAGKAPRAIVKQLNRECIVGPSGGSWGPSTINGNPSRGTGLLNNELYVGRIVWNRLSYRKDPETGKRRSRVNPEKDWVHKENPELRIVSDDLWQSVKARQQEMRRDTRPDKRTKGFWSQKRPRYLLSGLMKCGCCASNFTKHGANRFACAAARDRGSCANHLTVRGDELEAAVLDGLKLRLMEPELFQEFAREFVAELNRQRSSLAADRTVLEREQVAVSRHIDRLVDAVMNGADALALNGKLKELEARKSAITAELESKPASEPLLHPNLAEFYRAKVANLERAVRSPEGEDVFGIVRSLIESVQLTPVDGRLEIALRGDLAGILAIAGRGKAPDVKDRALQIKVVAGARNSFGSTCLQSGLKHENCQACQ